MRKAPAGNLTIRGLMGCCFVLADGDASVMIDTGLVGEPFWIRRLVRKRGLRPDSIKAILLTHGHLDHAGNLAWLREWTGARVLAHAEEVRHVAGTYPYQGVARWCGRLEVAVRCGVRHPCLTWRAGILAARKPRCDREPTSRGSAGLTRTERLFRRAGSHGSTAGRDAWPLQR